MMHTGFSIMLAGIPIAVSCFFESTKYFCRDYVTDEPPEIAICLEENDILFERTVSKPDREWSDAYLETLALYRRIAEELVLRDVLLFHGSVIAVDGDAYLFTGKSGAGKSTHARLWEQELKGSHSVFMVNDDKPLLRFDGDRILAYGTPWNGKHRRGTNAWAPVKAVADIVQAEKNEIISLLEEARWPLLFRQCYHPKNAAAMEKTFSMLDRMSRNIFFYEMRCDISPEAAQLAYRVMSGQENEHDETEE